MVTISQIPFKENKDLEIIVGHFDCLSAVGSLAISSDLLQSVCLPY
jgi:hypothetical protein